MNSTAAQELKVFLLSPPYSTDPIEYDAFVHHIAFRSIYSSIISDYGKNNFNGILVDHWSHSPSFKEWVFQVKDDLTFENGEEITSKIIVQSWTRLAYLMKKKSSYSEFFDNLIGIEELKSPSSKVLGMKFNGKSISLTFKKPVTHLLSVISFGIYAIVHPNDYHPITGLWNHSNQLTSSGPYKIKKWDENNLSLELRQEFKISVGHPKRFKKINFFWNSSRLKEADLIMGDSVDHHLDGVYQFFGGDKTSIAYIKCRSWKLNDSPCNNLENRLRLRTEFYKNMGLSPTKIIKSFLPLAIKNVSENLEPVSSENSNAKRIKTLIFAHSSRQNPFFQRYNTAIKKAGSIFADAALEVIVPRDIWMQEYNPDLNHYCADLYMLSTGISAKDCISDLKFAFLSQEGIRLPDEHGFIRAELNKDVPDIQYINNILWTEAIIWPVTHYASGLWAKNGIDFSLINLVRPPTDFQWIGQL